ncbi:MAG: hypothetical protein QF655_00370 [Candidatus Woesearchaeota archaeon]|nr:hypothetical protein [Candidatus Woesearchaeota archaeon]MDP6265595.1 hypothetical protein [Candidatus Woesearchaeota archaeon]MDP7323106.1 hypothetical protein [Candidatus Woesearchaeota archaeon]MDP7476075.1 hypothetical protein [Candidatus Woesearchaeota archaeon]HJO01711.1 hypothetical protein [Candidatus Woesearchaeota archaeon]
MLSFNIFKRNFMEWKDYKKKIDFLENFYWQQSVRKQSIRNL